MTLGLFTLVINALLDGADPASILCLTYTKAAASEMSNRVFARLSEWAVLSDEELSKRIAAIATRGAGFGVPALLALRLMHPDRERPAAAVTAAQAPALA